jgi:hypothetical protein
MQLLLKATCLTVALSAASLAFAVDTPFAGTWKLNLDKRRLVGDTVTFTPVEQGMRINAGGESYEFKADGSENKTRFGTAAWSKILDQSWQEIDNVNGRLDAKIVWTLSGDSKTLVAHITGEKPGGGSFDDTSTYVRTAGTHGFAGTWKSREYKGSSPSLLVISDAENGLSFDEPDFKLKASGTFDGKPGNVEGPTIPPGASFSMTRVGVHTFKMTRTQSGKPFDMSTWTVSPNGRLLNVVTRTAGTNDPPVTAVYEKQ